jgi:hypothetical protein
VKKYLIIIVLPIYIQAQPLDESVSYLSNYIISAEFSFIRNTYGDIAAIDTLYLQALSYHKGDITEALLTTAFATLAFKELPVRVPILELKLELPLAHVSDSLFNKKVDSLPKDLFFNSPKTEFGDKDKVSHFFGSAYLAYSVTFFKLSKFMGIFVEFFEAAFKVEGFLDLRDIAVNNLGELFGNALNKNPDLLPSQVLKIYNLFYFQLTN